MPLRVLLSGCALETITCEMVTAAVSGAAEKDQWLRTESKIPAPSSINDHSFKIETIEYPVDSGRSRHDAQAI
jgi:hypothetical protein